MVSCLSLMLCGIIHLSLTTSASVTDCVTNKEKSIYDYIVVGSGPGGTTIATRLALNDFKVLLIEAGPDYDDLVTQTPVLWPVEQLNPLITAHFNPFLFSKEEKTTIEYPRGITLGGSAHINAMIAVTAVPSDWDNIAQVTNDADWNSRNIQTKYEKLVENCEYCSSTDPTANKNGWLDVYPLVRMSVRQMNCFHRTPLEQAWSPLFVRGKSLIQMWTRTRPMTAISIHLNLSVRVRVKDLELIHVSRMFNTFEILSQCVIAILSCRRMKIVVFVCFVFVDSNISFFFRLVSTILYLLSFLIRLPLLNRLNIVRSWIWSTTDFSNLVEIFFHLKLHLFLFTIANQEMFRQLLAIASIQMIFHQITFNERMKLRRPKTINRSLLSSLFNEMNHFDLRREVTFRGMRNTALIGCVSHNAKGNQLFVHRSNGSLCSRVIDVVVSQPFQSLWIPMTKYHSNRDKQTIDR